MIGKILHCILCEIKNVLQNHIFFLNVSSFFPTHPDLHLVVLKFCHIRVTLLSLLLPGLLVALSSCRLRLWTLQWWYEATASFLSPIHVVKSSSLKFLTDILSVVLWLCCTLWDLGCCCRKLHTPSACWRRWGHLPDLVSWRQPCPSFYTICPVQVRDSTLNILPFIILQGFQIFVICISVWSCQWISAWFVCEPVIYCLLD